MRIRSLPIDGYYEEVEGRTSEVLQILAPETDLDEQLLSWAILKHNETVASDDARRDYIFNYGLEEHLGNGLYKLRVTARDQSKRDHECEIVAGLSSAVSGRQSNVQPIGFVPMWIISPQHHFRGQSPGQNDNPPPTAFGRLDWSSPGALPQRRLFGAVVAR